MFKVTAKETLLMDGSINVVISTKDTAHKANIEQADWFATVKNWKDNGAELVSEETEISFDLPEIRIDPSFDLELWPNALEEVMKAISLGYPEDDYMNIDPCCVESWLMAYEEDMQ